MPSLRVDIVSDVFLSVQTIIWLPMLGILQCEQMLMPVITHRYCTNIIQKNRPLKIDPGRKKPSHTRESNLCPQLAGADTRAPLDACKEDCTDTESKGVCTEN